MAWQFDGEIVQADSILNLEGFAGLSESYAYRHLSWLASIRKVIEARRIVREDSLPDCRIVRKRVEQDIEAMRRHRFVVGGKLRMRPVQAPDQPVWPDLRQLADAGHDI